MQLNSNTAFQSTVSCGNNSPPCTCQLILFAAIMDQPLPVRVSGPILQTAVDLIRVVEVRGGVSVRAPWDVDGASPAGAAAPGSSSNVSSIGSSYFCAACVAAASGSSTASGQQQLQQQQARRRPARVLPLEAALKLLVAYGSAARALCEAEVRQLRAEAANGGGSSSGGNSSSDGGRRSGSSGGGGSSSGGGCLLSRRYAALVPLMRRARRVADHLMAQTER